MHSTEQICSTLQLLPWAEQFQWECMRNCSFQTMRFRKGEKDVT